MKRSAIDRYQQIRHTGSVQGASPHQLISILFDNAIERIVKAMGCMARGDIANKAQHLCVATSIVEGLRATTNSSAGGEIAANLHALYSYCIGELLRCNKDNNEQKLVVVADVLRELRAGWREIPSQYHFRSAPPSAIDRAGASP